MNKLKKIQHKLNIILFSVVFLLLCYVVFFYDIKCVNCDVVSIPPTKVNTPTVLIPLTHTPTKIPINKKQPTLYPTSTSTNISTNTPTPTETILPTNTATQIVANVDWCISAINSCGTNIRTQPYLTATIVGIMYNNNPHITDTNKTGIDCYKLVDYVEVNNKKWYVVEYKHHKQHFYIYPEYSKLNPIIP